MSCVVIYFKLYIFGLLCPIKITVTNYSYSEGYEFYFTLWNLCSLYDDYDQICVDLNMHNHHLTSGTSYLSHPEDPMIWDQWNVAPDQELQNPDHFYKLLGIISWYKFCPDRNIRFSNILPDQNLRMTEVRCNSM